MAGDRRVGWAQKAHSSEGRQTILDWRFQILDLRVGVRSLGRVPLRNGQPEISNCLPILRRAGHTRPIQHPMQATNLRRVEQDVHVGGGRGRIESCPYIVKRVNALFPA
jgi:hypothetical protein